MRVFFRSTSRVLRAAKVHASITGLPLQAAQNELAFVLGYADLHELQRVAASGQYALSPDDEDLSPEDLYDRRTYQTQRLVEYRQAATARKVLDEMTARAIVDDVRPSARVRSIGRTLRVEGDAAQALGDLAELFQYASSTSTWAVPVRSSTTRAHLAERSRQLIGMVPDHIVLLSVAPHDVKQRKDWDGIELLFASIAPHVSTIQVLESDIARIAQRWPDVDVLID